MDSGSLYVLNNVALKTSCLGHICAALTFKGLSLFGSVK